MSLGELLNLANQGGVLALLVFLLVGGFRGWWVYGPTHKALMDGRQKELDRVLIERDRLLELALSATNQAGVAVEHLTRDLRGLERQP